MKRFLLCLLCPALVAIFVTFSFGQTTVAVDDFYIVDQAEYLGIWINDLNIRGQPWIVDDAINGHAFMEFGNADARYVPDSGYIGFDLFTYRYRVALNPDEWSNTASVLLAVLSQSWSARECNKRKHVA